MQTVYRILSRSLAVALLALMPMAGVAQSADAVAARLGELGVQWRSQPLTAETLIDVESVALMPRFAREVTDADMALFAHLPRLRTLALNNATNPGPEGLAQLAAVPSLESLSLRFAELRDDHVAALAGLEGLRALDLTGNRQFTDAALGLIAQNAGLVDLRLEDTAVGDAGMALLAGHPGLQVLWLGRTEVTDAAFSDIARISGLRRLSFQGASAVQGTEVGALSVLTRLGELNLSQTGITDAALVPLGAMTQLRRLYLGQTAVSDVGLASLSGLVALEGLYIDETAVSDTGLANLAGLAGLRTLWASNTAITDEGVILLTGLSLTTLHLNETAITDAGLMTLASIGSLRNLSLRRTQVTEEGVAAAQAAPGANPRLRIAH